METKGVCVKQFLGFRSKLLEVSAALKSVQDLLVFSLKLLCLASTFQEHSPDVNACYRVVQVDMLLVVWFIKEVSTLTFLKACHGLQVFISIDSKLSITNKTKHPTK